MQEERVAKYGFGQEQDAEDDLVYPTYGPGAAGKRKGGGGGGAGGIKRNRAGIGAVPMVSKTRQRGLESVNGRFLWLTSFCLSLPLSLCMMGAFRCIV